MKYKFFAISSLFIALVGLFAFVGTPVLLSLSEPSVPCYEPLTYRFGKIDPRFDISKKELKKIMKEVETLWATAMDRDLLDYDNNGRVVIHLVYGEDQQRTEDERRLSSGIEVLKEQVEMTETEYKSLTHAYRKQREELQHALSAYRDAVQNYNKMIASWQTPNGVPKSKKTQVKRMQGKISTLKSQLHTAQANAEAARKRVNAKSDRLNHIIDEQNELIAKYNSKFAKSKKFDQGRYVKEGSEEKINIFQFSNRAELKTVLAHETGHAMGLNHVEDPKAIMNAMMAEQDIFHLALTKEDIGAIRQQCQ